MTFRRSSQRIEISFHKSAGVKGPIESNHPSHLPSHIKCISFLWFRVFPLHVAINISRRQAKANSGFLSFPRNHEKCQSKFIHLALLLLNPNPKLLGLSRKKNGKSLI